MDLAAGSGHSSSVERLGAAVQTRMALWAPLSRHRWSKLWVLGMRSRKLRAFPLCDSVRVQSN